jgi:hypothetical protein
MCDPLTIAGIALTAGSVVANSVAAGEQARARDAVLAAERMRQNALDREAWGLNTASQDRFVNFQPQQDARAAEIGDFLGATVTPDANTEAATVMPSSSSDVVNQERTAQRADAQGYVDQQGMALANLRSFGDLLGEKSRLQARDAGLIGQIGGFKAGSSNVVPFELDQAAKAGDGWAMLGDILSGAGSITTGAGLSGSETALHKLFGLKTAAGKAGAAGLSLVPGAGELLRA